MQDRRTNLGVGQAQRQEVLDVLQRGRAAELHHVVDHTQRRRALAVGALLGLPANNTMRTASRAIAHQHLNEVLVEVLLKERRPLRAADHRGLLVGQLNLRDRWSHKQSTATHVFEQLVLLVVVRFDFQPVLLVEIRALRFLCTNTYEQPTEAGHCTRALGSPLD